MNIKRTVASLLVLSTLVNLCPITTAEIAEPITQKHTVTWTMDADSYTLKPITGSRTAMVDEGSRLINAKGEAETEIQTTYYRDRTLASVSMNGTGFSFSPIMLEEYYPQEISDETEDTEINEDTQDEQPELTDKEELQDESLDQSEEIDINDTDEIGGIAVSEAAETETAVTPVDDNPDTVLEETEENVTETPASDNLTVLETETEGELITDHEDAETVIEIIEDNNQSIESSSVEPEETAEGKQSDETEPAEPLNTPQSEINEEPTTDTQANESDMENTPEDTPDSEQTATQESELPPEPQQLETGYAKTIRKTTLYKEKHGQDELGLVKNGTFVYIIACQEGQRARVVFDTPEGIVEGYIKANHLENLTESEEEHVRHEASKAADVRKYQGSPLFRVTNFEPSEAEQPEELPNTEEEAEQEASTEPTLSVDPAETPTTEPADLSTAVPIAPSATEPTTTSTDDPTVESETELTPAPTDIPTEVPTNVPTNVPTPEPTPTPTEAPTPEPTETSTIVPTAEPTNEPTPAPTAAPTDAPTPEPTTAPTSAPTAEPTDVPTTAPTPENVPEPSSDPTPDSDQGDGLAGLLKFLIPSAKAEENPEENPEAIQSPSEKDTQPEATNKPERPSSITGRKTGGMVMTAAKSTSDNNAKSKTGSVSAIVYAGLFDAVTDVKLTARTNGVKEDITVHQYTGNHVYAYRLNTDGLNATLSGQTVILTDSYGNSLARINAPDMTDANGVHSTDIAVSLTGGGNGYLLTYRPNDEWMKNAAYPVTIDPTGEYFNNIATGIGDIYVTSGSPDKHFALKPKDQTKHNDEGNNLWVGQHDGNSIAYVWPSLHGMNDSQIKNFPDDPILVTKATWKMNVHELTGSGKFRISLITGSWNTSSVTYNTKPSISSDIYVDVTLTKGWNTIDLKKIFSAWFNALDQKTNYGFAITSSDSSARICSSDILPRSERMQFSAEYYTGITAPTVKATAYGNDVNSGTGYVTLNWNKVEGAEGYLVATRKTDGSDRWDYQYVGDQTTYTTGTLNEIPNASISDLNYYFAVLPCNKYSQVADNTLTQVKTVLPDRLPPMQPTTVSASPAGWSKNNSVKITWAGVQDVPVIQGVASSEVIQYALNPTGDDQTKWNWLSTGSGSSNGSFDLNTSSFSDGAYTLYIRGKDSAGNYGAARGTTFGIDRTAPTQPTVSVVPAGWASQNSGSFSWKGISDLNEFTVEYAVDTGAYTSTGSHATSANDFSVSLAGLTEGTHSLKVRAKDSLGNVGKDGTASFYIDRTAPVIGNFTADPSGWTNGNAVDLKWTGVSDATSGVKDIAISFNNGDFSSVTVSASGTKTQDISTLKTGIYPAKLKVTDQAGTSVTVQANVYIDRSQPTLKEAKIKPESWTSQKSVELTWTGAKDDGSGVASVSYTIDGGSYTLLSAYENDVKNIDVSACADGEHVMTVRVTDGMGYTVEKDIPFYVDRTAPILKELTLKPDAWTKENEIELSWTGATDATSGLKNIEWQIDTGDTQSLNVAANGNTVLDVSALADGEHSLVFLLTDNAGIEQKYQETIWIDRSNPEAGSITVTPTDWSDTETLDILWEEAKDDFSGLKQISYSLDGGITWLDEGNSENGSAKADVSQIPDGQQQVVVCLTDEAGNTVEYPLDYCIDRTDPIAEIISPADGDTVSGILEILGSVSDISLTGWTFTATGKDDHKVVLTGDQNSITAGSLGLVDTGIFEDGEEITVSLTVADEAGHRTTTEGVYIKAVHTAQKVQQELTLTVPENGAVLSENTTGSYTLQYPEEEDFADVYLDDKQDQKTSEGTFSVQPILYGEDTYHTLTVISTDEDGDKHYSQGFQSLLVYSSLLQNDTGLLSSENLSFTTIGAEVTGNQATFMTTDCVPVRPVVALRLHTHESASGDYVYEISTDSGNTWTKVQPDKDVVFESPQSKIRLRCTMIGNGSVLSGIDLTGIYESSATRFKAHLLKDVTSYKLTLPTKTNEAILKLNNDCKETLTERNVYINGVREDDHGSLSVLPYADGTAVSIAQTGLSNGTLYGTSASVSILLREAPYARSTYDSGSLSAGQPIYALRLEALCLDEDGKENNEAEFYAVPDEEAPIQLTTGQYVYLPKAADQIRITAKIPDNVVLAGIHLEGISLKPQSVVLALSKDPSGVKAKDYGLWPENDRRFELSWTAPNSKDSTATNTQWFEIYRDGEKIATVTGNRYTDYDYVSGAEYRIVAVSVYDDPEDGKENILSRTGQAAHASVESIPTPVVITPTPAPTSTPVPTPTPTPAATPTPTPALATAPPTNGGQYSETTPAPTAPLNIPISFESEFEQYREQVYTVEGVDHPLNFELDQSLLGPTRFCSLGFEPINFNTGNFFVEARDIQIPDAGDGALDLIRTYNSQSLESDTPFGAKWSSEITQTLMPTEDGKAKRWRRTDGSEVLWIQDANGIWRNNSSEYEQLTENGAGYSITLTDDTVYVFAADGTLSKIEKNDGQQTITLVRDQNGNLKGITLASGRKIAVRTDKDGHITRLTLPDGKQVIYTYDGNDLVSVTDPDGYTVRYEYTGLDLMTAWYDGNGACQAQNEYDDQWRVIAQTDAEGGRYTLEYGDDYTVTTDAEGNRVTYYRDEKQRTTRIVEDKGETTFTYGIQGEIISKQDALGRVTVYAYNECGDKVSETDARGISVFFEWDGKHHLLSKKDQNGNLTSYTYDKNGNLLTETAPDGGVTAYTYDKDGHVLTVTDAAGHITSYAYDKNGLLSETTDPNGNKTQIRYDANNRIATVTNALGEKTIYRYTSRGDLAKVTFADGTSVSYTYDALGNCVSMTDPEGNRTKYEFNGLGLLTRVILPDGTTQDIAYTPAGQVSSQTDALGNTVSYTYDSLGNRLTATDAEGHTTAMEYDAEGQLLRETNPAGGVTEYAYDPVSLPLTVKDAAGITQTFAYDGNGNILERILPDGGKIQNEYDCMDRPVRQVNALGGETRIEYDLLGNIISITDPLGGMTRCTYDANGNLLTLTDALGNVTEYTYDALNRLKTEKNANGAVTQYDYDAAGNLRTVTDALGNKTKYAYNRNDQLTALTDALGHKVTVKYDRNGQAISARQKNGGTLGTEYDAAGRVISETDANGHVTAYSYNKNGLVSGITDAIGQTATFEYDSLGNVIMITAPGDAVTLYEYDNAGRITAVTDAEKCTTEYTYNAAGLPEAVTVNGNATVYEYDAAGNILSATDAEGREVCFTYDPAGNLTEVIYPDGSKDITEYDLIGRVVKTIPRTGLATAYTYDAMGNVLCVNEGDRTTAYEYDLLGRLTKMIAADGTETKVSYDALGNIVSEEDPTGAVTKYQYNAESLLTKITYANNVSQSVAYDLAGNTIRETDPEGHTKKYLYDEVNRLTGVTDELGNTTSYAYDAFDNIARVTDALGHVTEYTYDTNGNLLSETDALGNTVQYTYTPEGWLEQVTKADGNVIRFEYDKTGSLLKQDAGEGYTVTGSYNELGQVTEVSSKEGKITYQYNNLGRLVSVTNVNGDKVSYTWDEYGNKTGMVYPDGREMRYTYDIMGRMTEVTGLDGEITRYAYDAAGRRILTENAENTTTYEYDRIGSLIRQETTGAGAVTFTYGYNKNGYITKENRTENGTTTESKYTYDAMGQLTGFRQNTGYAEKYTYDAAGNMLQKQITGTDGKRVQLAMQYNAGNQLTEMTTGNEHLTYSYDPNGSMTAKTLTGTYGTLTDKYTYNVLDQLSEYTGYDGYRQKYTYDANGMRLSKETYGNGNRSTLEELLRGDIAGLPEVIRPGTQEDNSTDEYEWATEEYLYDITQEYYQVIAKTEKTANEEKKTAYAYGLERIAAYEPNQRTTYVYDGRGSVAKTVTTLKTGETQEQNFLYTAFGEQMSTQKVSDFGYNAEAYDAATGMINLRARQYEPAMGRFEQKDIIAGSAGLPSSQHRYTYVMNNSIMFVDPMGMQAVLGMQSVRVVCADGGGKIKAAEVKNTSFFSKVGDNIKNMVNSAAVAIEQVAVATTKAKALTLCTDVVTAKDKRSQNQAANVAFEFFNENIDYLPSDMKEICTEADKKLENKNLSKAERNTIMRTACKLMLADTEDKTYDRTNPITIANKSEFGTHYSLVPYEYFVDAAFFMADNPNFVSREKGLEYSHGVWSMDCIYTQAFIAKSWMDEDVYKYYQDKGYIKLKVSYQFANSDSTGPIDYDNLSQYPVGTGFYYDKDGDGKGDQHIGYQLGGDIEYNGVLYSNAMFSSPGGKYGQPLRIYEIETVNDYKLFGTSNLYVP